MEYVFFFIIIMMLLDLESKISKNIKKNENKKIYPIELNELIGKKVCLNIENDNIENAYLFDPVSSTEGIIKEFDEEWLLFEYNVKNEIIQQYFRIEDIVSIDELK